MRARVEERWWWNTPAAFPTSTHGPSLGQSVCKCLSHVCLALKFLANVSGRGTCVCGGGKACRLENKGWSFFFFFLNNPLIFRMTVAPRMGPVRSKSSAFYPKWKALLCCGARRDGDAPSAAKFSSEATEENHALWIWDAAVGSNELLLRFSFSSFYHLPFIISQKSWLII